MAWVWADNTGAHVSSQLWKEEEGGRKPGEVSPLSTTLSKAKGHKPAPSMPKFSLHLPPCYWGKRTCQEWSPIPSSHPLLKSWPRLSIVSTYICPSWPGISGDEKMQHLLGLISTTRSQGAQIVSATWAWTEQCWGKVPPQHSILLRLLF